MAVALRTERIAEMELRDERLPVDFRLPNVREASSVLTGFGVVEVEGSDIFQGALSD